jgi:hypothetical protein
MREIMLLFEFGFEIYDAPCRSIQHYHMRIEWQIKSYYNAILMKQLQSL